MCGRISAIGGYMAPAKASAAVRMFRYRFCCLSLS